MATKQASKPAPKKGRNPIAPAEIVSPPQDDAALAERGQQLQVLAKAEAKVQALATSIGYAGALDTESLWATFEYRQRRSVEDILEMGRALVLLKEQTPHGEFEQRLGDRGVHPRAARRLMSVALKFTKTDTMSVLKAAGTQAKVLELAVLEDEELAALEAGDSVGDIRLDDIERMSTSELRQALRDRDATLEAREKRIGKLSDDLNRAEEKASLLPRLKPEEKAARMFAELETRYADARQALRQAEADTAKFLDYANDKGIADFDDDLMQRAKDMSNPLLSLLTTLFLSELEEPKKHALDVLKGR